jgi:hypothetical protein
MLSLPFEDLKPELDGFNANQQAAWSEFQDFRVRRDIAMVLLDAHLKPGKFFSQFDELRSHDTERLDRELVAIMRSDPNFAEALNLAADEAMATDYLPEITFKAPWRRLSAATGAFEPALRYQQAMESAAPGRSARTPIWRRRKC